MSMKDDARRDMGTYGEFAEECEHGRQGYWKFGDVDDDYASTPHPSAHYEELS